MAQKIVWTSAAVEDLQSIFNFIARDSEENAASAIGQIMDSVELVSEFPFIGRIVPEYDEVTVRETIVYSYRVVYHVRPGLITVVGVIHGARRLKRALKGRDV